ncbi:MAG: SDR family oxidoreductase [Betaproteobacteria bacterium]|nr:SDR family oxidoreductase [Betaproteobacteria bacterium]MBU6512588.1 SDR family oxidoreductase [Betaproteobacteria bacterium]MDE1955399.1 SDR family oxidoreductase [Betaproteobacteria bacterium]MDE2152934.1 SDR family oxidoreductase [Betaproteobacteria bacterium]
MQLSHKSALVTGAASGFGRAIAERYAREGASVLIADLDADGAEAAAEALRAQGARAAAVRCDVSSSADYAAAVARAVSEFGGLDIVVNNAGTTHANKPALQVTEAEFDRVMRVNLKSLYWSAQHALPVLSRPGGVMINVASTTGVRPGPGLSWYSASKAAMINISRGLALEFAREGIRVNAINPMIGETALLEQFMGMPDTPENRQRFLARIPLGRFTRPDDVAGAAVFLASDDASFLTGSCIDVDGGRNL